jgi:hypothetical protein
MVARLNGMPQCLCISKKSLRVLYTYQLRERIAPLPSLPILFDTVSFPLSGRARVIVMKVSSVDVHMKV